MTAENQNPQTVHTVIDIHLDLQVRRFLDECTVRDLDDSEVLPVADLYGMYIIWCEHAEATPMDARAFSTLIRAEGIDSGTSHREKFFKGVLATGPIPIQYILETDKCPGPNSTLEYF